MIVDNKITIVPFFAAWYEALRAMRARQHRATSDRGSTAATTQENEMSNSLEGQHYCKEHQGNYSHYAKHNCAVCQLQEQLTKEVEISAARAKLSESDAEDVYRTIFKPMHKVVGGLLSSENIGTYGERCCLFGYHLAKESSAKEISAKQAEIDALMLEFCSEDTRRNTTGKL